MTVIEWRKKHKRCKFCAHCVDVLLPPWSTANDTWCKAKKKIVNDEINRRFCKVYEVKENDNG